MRNYLIFIWSLMDPLYYHCTNLTFPTKEDNIFRVRLTKYKGRNVILSDGTQINKNDLLVKIHLHNVRLLKEMKNIQSELKKVKMIHSYVKRSLPGVDVYLQNHPLSSEIKGIIGVTALYKGSERFGFEIFEVSHPVYKWFKKFAHLPIELLAGQYNVLHILKHHKPSYLFMSAGKLSTLYRTNSIS